MTIYRQMAEYHLIEVEHLRAVLAMRNDFGGSEIEKQLGLQTRMADLYTSRLPETVSC